MKLATKIAYNTIAQIISKIISTIIGLLTIAIITRYLGAQGFGEYTTITTFLSFFAIVADLGLTLVTVQLISPKNADQEKIVGNLLGIRLISALIFIGAGPLLVFFFPYSLAIKLGVLTVAASYFFVALNQILVGIFQKNLRMDKVSIAEIASRLVLLGGIILVADFGLGLYGILAATVISSFVNFIIHYYYARRFSRLHFRFDLSYWKIIMQKSWPLAITIVFNLIYLKTDTLFLSIIPRPSQIGIIAEVGLYGAAYKVIDVLITLPFMFAGIILPVLTSAWVEKNKKDFAAVLQKSFDIMVIIALPIVAGTQLLATDVITLVTGKEFAAAGPILQWLIWACAFIFLGNMFAHAIIAIDCQKKIIGAYIFVAITSVIAYSLLIPRFSYFGAAMITIYSEAMIAFASYFLVYKQTKFIPNLSVALKSAAASILMFLALYYEYHNISQNVFIIILSSILIYFPLLIIFKGIKKTDLLTLLNK